jgi:hypothetical protein
VGSAPPWQGVAVLAPQAQPGCPTTTQRANSTMRAEAAGKTAAGGTASVAGGAGRQRHPPPKRGGCQPARLQRAMSVRHSVPAASVLTPSTGTGSHPSNGVLPSSRSLGVSRSGAATQEVYASWGALGRLFCFGSALLFGSSVPVAPAEDRGCRGRMFPICSDRALGGAMKAPAARVGLDGSEWNLLRAALSRLVHGPEIPPTCADYFRCVPDCRKQGAGDLAGEGSCRR